MPYTSVIYRKTDREHTEEAIRELLENRRLIHVSFIGYSVMELFVEKQDSTTIIALLRSAGMIYMPHFNVFKNALRNRGATESLEGKEKNMAMVRGRARYCAEKATTYVAREWYASLSKAANRRYRI